MTASLASFSFLKSKQRLVILSEAKDLLLVDLLLMDMLLVSTHAWRRIGHRKAGPSRLRRSG